MTHNHIGFSETWDPLPKTEDISSKVGRCHVPLNHDHGWKGAFLESFQTLMPKVLVEMM